MTDQEERPLFAKEAAYVLNITLHELMELIRQGKLKGLKQEGQWRFRAADVLACVVRRKPKQ